jgi:hypothetical protein
MPFWVSRIILIATLMLPSIMTIPRLAQTDAVQPASAGCDLPSIDEPYVQGDLEAFAEEVGLNTGFVSYFAIRDAALLGISTYQVSADQPVTLDYHMYRIGDNALNIRLILLLNEQQVEVSFDGHRSHYHDRIIQPRQETSLSFELPQLDSGMYNVVLMAILNPDSNPSETPDFDSFRSNALRRLTLLFGDDTPLKRDVNYELLDAAESREKAGGSINFNLSLDDSLKVWNYPERTLSVTSGSEVTFNIQTGYITDSLDSPYRTSRFALILFYGGTQQAAFSEQSVLYAEVDDDNAYTAIPVRVVAAHAAGYKDIIAIRIENPDLPLCRDMGTVTQQSLAFDFWGQRHSIEVIP